MINVAQEAERLTEEIIRDLQDTPELTVGLTANAVREVLEFLVQREPELMNRFHEVRDHVYKALRDHVDKSSGIYYAFVHVDLSNDGLTVDFKLPENLEVPQNALDRILKLHGSERYSFQLEVLAYIILTSKSVLDIRRRMVAAKFATDSNQLLMPSFHHLCDSEPMYKKKLLVEMLESGILDGIEGAEEFIEDYAFKLGDHPYITCYQKSEELGIDKNLIKPLNEVMILAMLSLLKEYLSN